MILKRVLRRLATRAFPELADAGARLRAIESAFVVLANDSRYENDLKSFNGQLVRREITTQVLRAMRPARIVETGTCLGDTTGYFAGFDVPVTSCEISAPLHFAATRRLAGLHGIRLEHGDSRVVLRRLIAEGANGFPTFFYLDAHWHDDLPLQDEISIIDGSWERYVILVDDFQVPGDDGYGYDNYGRAKTLDYACIERYVTANGIAAFFPNVPSSAETGARRGCVFLARHEQLVGILSGTEKLTRHGRARAPSES